MKKVKEKLIPAIPPQDYRGSVADWMVTLAERGLWDGNGWHGDVYIKDTDWWEILEECEREESSTTKLKNISDSTMKKFICWLKDKAIFLAINVAASLLGGTMLWVFYPHIHALFPSAAANGILSYHLGWVDSICIMFLIEIVFRPGFTAAVDDDQEEEEEEEENDLGIDKMYAP